MKSSTQLILFGVLGFFTVRILGKSRIEEYDDSTESEDNVVIPGGPTNAPMEQSQWLVAYSIQGVENVVWNYQRPYQWTPSGIVTSWNTYFLIGNRTHTGFTSSSDGGNPNGIYTQITVNGKTVNAYFNLAEAVAVLNSSNSPKDPTGPSTNDPNFEPHWMYLGSEKEWAATYSDHVRLDSLGYTHESGDAIKPTPSWGPQVPTVAGFASPQGPQF